MFGYFHSNFDLSALTYNSIPPKCQIWELTYLSLKKEKKTNLGVDWLVEFHGELVVGLVGQTAMKKNLQQRI